MVAFAELRARRVWYDQRGELDVTRRATEVARCAGRSWHRSVANDAGYRVLLVHRDGRADSGCGETWLRRCANVAAVLLQGRHRRGSLRLLQRRGATRRPPASAKLSLRQSDGGGPRDHAKTGRAAPW